MQVVKYLIVAGVIFTVAYSLLIQADYFEPSLSFNDYECRDECEEKKGDQVPLCWEVCGYSQLAPPDFKPDDEEHIQ